VTEIEIRDRIRAALGDAEYPEGLGTSLAAHLAGAGDRNTARLQTLIAAVLVLAVLAAVALPRLARDYGAWTSSARTVPAARQSPVVTSPAPSATTATLPLVDLEAAGLADTPGAVTPFDKSATDSGYTVTLIGLYADSSRTIVFLHVEPDLGFPGSVSVADQQAASGSGNRGAPGDYVYRLATAPRVGADGYADLTIIVFGGPPYAVPKRLPGNWVFTARVRLQP
jgi:hypothetical protein